MSNRKFVFLFIYINLLIFVAVSPFIIFLIKTKEYSTVQEIAKEQFQNKSIYGTALNNNTFLYKLELIRTVKPDIIAIGSSRTMQIRENFFNSSFISAGGAMNSLKEGEILIRKILEIYKPKILILGVYFWWFNENYNAGASSNYNLDTTNILFFEKIINPIKWVVGGKINPVHFMNVLFFNNYSNNVTNYKNIGISALVSSDGFRKDGSYLYSNTIFGKETSNDVKFADTISRIEKGKYRFEHGDKVSQKSIDEFKKILDICEKNNIKVVFFIPPVSQIVHEKLNEYKKNYNYINEFRQKIIEFGGYDYHNSAFFGFNDCEFIDGFHGGDIVYQRILLDLSRKDNTIKNIVNINEVKKNISRFNGKSTTFYELQNRKEVDFLGLGCEK